MSVTLSPLDAQSKYLAAEYQHWKWSCSRSVKDPGQLGYRQFKSHHCGDHPPDERGGWTSSKSTVWRGQNCFSLLCGSLECLAVEEWVVVLLSTHITVSLCSCLQTVSLSSGSWDQPYPHAPKLITIHWCLQNQQLLERFELWLSIFISD